MCKKLKVNPDPQIIRHYKDGEFNREYDRQLSVTSIVNFMRDPTGDMPWEEDADSADVLHLTDISVNQNKVPEGPLLTSVFAGSQQANQEGVKANDGHVLCALVWILQNTKT
jgi:hypothetical protein